MNVRHARVVSFGFWSSLLACCLAVKPAPAQEPFAKLVGDAKVSPVEKGETLEVPFILWGGDVATFLANGGLATKPGTIFQLQGLNIKLVPGDNFPEQVKRYLGGKSPFLRGTMSMLGQASEVTAADPRTRPVVFLQLTWSAGDWMVSRDKYKTLNDLRPEGSKKKRIALQAGGPHVGMLGDILDTVRLKWSDIDVVWTKDVTGKQGPAERMRSDPSVDACFAVTPDMQALTGGPDKTGNGSEGTLKGARVLVSTRSMKRSIADVYACRKDYYDSHKEIVEKFAAGYLKGCEDLLEIKGKYNKDKDATARYKAVLKLALDIYGKEALPSEADADGLVSDAVFVNLPGNYAFFKDRANPSGFKDRQKAALDVAMAVGSIHARAELSEANMDYERLKERGKLLEPTQKAVAPLPVPQKFEPVKEDTIVDFTITFDEDTPMFDSAKYGEDFERAVRQASLFGNAVMQVRGHADIGNLLQKFTTAAMRQGLLRRAGNAGSYRYFLADGTELQLKNTEKVLELVNQIQAERPEDDPKLVFNGLMDLSKKRAESVKNAVLEYAQAKNLRLDENQFRSEGVGPKEPIKSVPRKPEERALNRRAEFRLIKINIETAQQTDF